MSFFNDAQKDALLTGRYICSECGALMEFEDEYRDTLVCPECGYSIDLDHYGFENDEEYEDLYPTREEVLGYDEEGSEDEYHGESYDEVYGELSDD